MESTLAEGATSDDPTRAPLHPRKRARRQTVSYIAPSGRERISGRSVIVFAFVRDASRPQPDVRSHYRRLRLATAVSSWHVNYPSLPYSRARAVDDRIESGARGPGTSSGRGMPPRTRERI